MTLENFLAIGDKYKEISSLKRFVIAPAVEQINTNTDFNIDISFRKCKREIRWIQLRFNQKQEAKALANEAKAKCKARAIQNQAAKQNRLIEEQKQANQASEQQAAID
ncbi:replication initiation protein [Snodgrassella gandavensis]|uniref:replication initiation protein n=1 Tax=Snodgrassella gandavensis TaxID=2946698 RepID=UPI001EF6ED1E|nr:replication initiation protein [Snodgrassella gandavensis]